MADPIHPLPVSPAQSAALFPSSVRRKLAVGLGVLLVVATYLIAVRGEALLLDLQTLTANVFCL